MHKVGMTSTDNVLVEMTQGEYASLCNIRWQSLGARMREYRKENSLSQEAFAKMVGLSRCHLSQIEGGKANFTKATYLSIVAVIGEPEGKQVRVFELECVWERAVNFYPDLEDLVRGISEGI